MHIAEKQLRYANRQLVNPATIEQPKLWVKEPIMKSKFLGFFQDFKGNANVSDPQALFVKIKVPSQSLLPKYGFGGEFALEFWNS